MNLTMNMARRGVPILFGASLLLLAGCTFPERDYGFMPDNRVIRVEQGAQGWKASPPDCELLYPARRRLAHDDRPQVAFGCATYTNLAASVARPQDLVQPAEYGGAQTDAATLAVQRYRENEVEPLRETDSMSKTGN
ncbi:CpaD family pilus assembly lipoprotein [Corticimicrobacter populi]|uniref:Pilus assembly protein n=1 Tax=Corticimicrobacter populi TaxID=2175229 RepID=A0A2V1K462_9BURK|nr:CpaD family pilus assembly lipoprotein [Corticimicrobacter populi]PWF24255.1 hypothetical protein DD235_07405 [Corticimicrobacter populi]